MIKTISIVIPVFNEEKRLYKTFEALDSLGLPGGLKLTEILFVNDGSFDKTLPLLDEYKVKSSLPIALISYTKNKGKGYAVKQGMLSTNSDYTLLADADMSTPFTELSKFMKFIDENADIIIGTRKNGKSTVTIHQPYIRELLGKIFTRITRIVLQVNVTDFTCGFKLFSKNAVQLIFPKSQINRWGYDAEILFIAKNQDLQIYEKPVTWADVKNSHVNIVNAMFQTIKELLQIRLLHSVKPTLTHFHILKMAINSTGKITNRLSQLFV